MHLHFNFFLFLFFETGFHYLTRLTLNSPCCSGWSWTHGPPTTASPGLGLLVFPPHPSLFRNFDSSDKLIPIEVVPISCHQQSGTLWLPTPSWAQCADLCQSDSDLWCGTISIWLSSITSGFMCLRHLHFHLCVLFSFISFFSWCLVLLLTKAFHVVWDLILR
jgi:hypothetical protein